MSNPEPQSRNTGDASGVSNPESSSTNPAGNPLKKWWRKLGDWLTYENKSEWLSDMRGSLSLTASIIATLTFQSALNPPGGVLQAGVEDSVQCPIGNSGHPCPGQAVLAVVYPVDYRRFLIFNTICFIASLSVCLFLVSGLPLNHRFPTWLLSIGMCITISTLAFTYLYGAVMVTPDAIWDTASSVFQTVLIVWITLSLIVGFFFTIRFIVWGVKWIKRHNEAVNPGQNQQTSIDAQN